MLLKGPYSQTSSNTPFTSFFDKKQPEAPVPPAMDANRAINNLVDNLEPLETSLPRFEVLHHKSFSKSEEDLDCLPQVGGGLATVH
jgi:hypothetical protein